MSVRSFRIGIPRDQAMLTNYLLFAIFFLGIFSKPIPDEDWGYVPIRSSGQMFWWLYGQQNQTTRDAAPLVIWYLIKSNVSHVFIGYKVDPEPVAPDLVILWRSALLISI